MDTSSTVFKALDVLTIVTARAAGVSVPDLALALNQPRTNVVRIVRTLQNYGFVACERGRWFATSTFRAWSTPSDRHQGFQRLYRPVLEAVAAATGELVVLGLHEGNGILHIDAIESVDRHCRAPARDIRFALRFSALGKLALSRRADIAAKIDDPRLHDELDEIRRTGIAWSRQAPPRGTVTMAMPGFSNLPTEPIVGVTWPAHRCNEQAAARAQQAVRDALAAPAAPKFFGATIEIMPKTAALSAKLAI